MPRGTTVRLTPLRRFMCDLLDASRRVPLVAIERTMPLAGVVAARRAAAPRPSWFAIFLKGYAAVAAARPELRRSYLTFPWHRLYQHPWNVASVAVARRVDDEDGVLAVLLRQPETMPLAEIDARLHAARTEPAERFGDFRRQLRLSRLPRPVRRLGWWFGLSVSGDQRAKMCGTFGVTGVAALGSASLSLLSPLTTTLTFGVIRDDGAVTARLFYDHRVLDGVEPARALAELEAALNGPIVSELRVMSGE